MNSTGKGIVLIVDDAPENLSYISQLLTLEGYQVPAANSGRRALMVAENLVPDLILLDVKMPEMDGFETCKRLKRYPRLGDVPIVFMSGLRDTEAKVRGFDTGAVDYVSKPFEPPELLARVETHIGLSRSRRELAEANEELKKLDRIRSAFIASVNHELRTPLNSIIGFSGLILQGMCGEISELQEDHLNRIHRSAKHILGLITEIIDISIVEGGGFDMKLEDVSVPEVIEAAMDSVRPQANKKELCLEAEYPKNLTIFTDRRRLLQCLVNFLGNEVKFAEEGSVKLRTTVTGDEVEFKVVNTGPGFTEAEAKSLFTTFDRLRGAKERRIEGTGLGLYITRKIASEILLGRVTAYPNKDKGCTFVLDIPRTRPEKNMARD